MILYTVYMILYSTFLVVLGKAHASNAIIISGRDVIISGHASLVGTVEVLPAGAKAGVKCQRTGAAGAGIDSMSCLLCPAIIGRMRGDSVTEVLHMAVFLVHVGIVRRCASLGSDVPGQYASLPTATGSAGSQA